MPLSMVEQSAVQCRLMGRSVCTEGIFACVSGNRHRYVHRGFLLSDLIYRDFVPACLSPGTITISFGTVSFVVPFHVGTQITALHFVFERRVSRMCSMPPLPHASIRPLILHNAVPHEFNCRDRSLCACELCQVTVEPKNRLRGTIYTFKSISLE